MALVSIVLPSYNRSDAIGRAVRSVIAQSHTEWELHVVDDGSSDDSLERLAGFDPRIVLHRQEHRGVAHARNLGLRACRGEYVAFLDSDDEWTPHHLELSVAFFCEFPQEHIISGEGWVDHGRAGYEKHFRVSMGEWFVELARQIGATSLDLPRGETDDYLRFYESRTQAGPWALRVLEKTPYRNVFHYRGDLSSKWRWGFLMALQTTALTRAAAEAVGPFDVSYPIASDFGYLAKLCRLYRANMISAPSCIKHDYAEGGRVLAEDHLVTGKTALQFAKDMLRWHQELFPNPGGDAELAGLRALCRHYVARMALRDGLTKEAAAQLAQAIPLLRDRKAAPLLLLARVMPEGAAARRAYAAAIRLRALPSRAMGKLTSFWHRTRSGHGVPIG
jgi:glycosyltransferase involved in cell wall biosynthesis